MSENGKSIPQSHHDPASEWWEKRQTVLREIVLRDPSVVSAKGKFKFDPNLYRLDYKSVLAILQYEALKEKMSKHTESGITTQNVQSH